MIENSMYKNQIDQKNSRILSLENRVAELEKEIEKAYIAGYEKGHDATVEGNYYTLNEKNLAIDYVSELKGVK